MRPLIKQFFKYKICPTFQRFEFLTLTIIQKVPLINFHVVHPAIPNTTFKRTSQENCGPKVRPAIVKTIKTPLHNGVNLEDV